MRTTTGILDATWYDLSRWRGSRAGPAPAAHGPDWDCAASPGNDYIARSVERCQEGRLASPRTQDRRTERSGLRSLRRNWRRPVRRTGCTALRVGSAPWSRGDGLRAWAQAGHGGTASVAEKCSRRRDGRSTRPTLERRRQRDDLSAVRIHDGRVRRGGQRRRARCGWTGVTTSRLRTTRSGRLAGGERLSPTLAKSRRSGAEGLSCERAASTDWLKPSSRFARDDGLHRPRVEADDLHAVASNRQITSFRRHDPDRRKKTMSELRRDINPRDAQR